MADENGWLVDGSPGGDAFRKGAHTARGCNRPGRSDLFVIEKGYDGASALAVELKVGKNAVSEDQEKYMARLRSKGWRCAVVRAHNKSTEARAEAVAQFAKIVREHMYGVGGGTEADPLVCD